MSERRRHAKKTNNSRVFIRIVLGLIVVLAVASAVAIYFEQESQMVRMLERQAKLERQLELTRSARDDLFELQNMVDTDEYIERIARDQLGMVRPNEIIFGE